MVRAASSGSAALEERHLHESRALSWLEVKQPHCRAGARLDAEAIALPRSTEGGGGLWKSGESVALTTASRHRGKLSGWTLDSTS